MDYKCFPLWIYKDNQLLYNDLPQEISDNKWLDDKLVTLQNQYDHLFEDTNTNFTYVGFSSDTEKSNYLNEFKKIENYLKEKMGTHYIIENQIEV